MNAAPNDGFELNSEAPSILSNFVATRLTTEYAAQAIPTFSFRYWDGAGSDCKR